MDKKSNIIKDINLNRIRKALKEIGVATKPQLSEVTGLSVVTVNSLIKTLINNGEIITDEMVSSEGGRPALSYRFNSFFRMALTINMQEYKGKDTAFYCVINLRGEVVERKEQILYDVNLESFDLYIEDLLNRYPTIQVIYFGIPGEEVKQRLVICDYEKLRDQSLSGYISDQFHIPVICENDINAAINGYCYKNEIRKDQCVVGLYFPEKYPPGAGVYLDNHIYKGRDGLVGEIKYLPLGINWDTFDFDPEKVQDIIVKTVQTFQCLYNPNKIILYGDGVKSNIKELLENRCRSKVEKMMVTDIILSNELHLDFEEGINAIALDYIDTVR